MRVLCVCVCVCSFTIVLPALRTTKVTCKATPKRTRVSFQVENEGAAGAAGGGGGAAGAAGGGGGAAGAAADERRAVLGKLVENNILGLQPGTTLTRYLQVPMKRVLFDVLPTEEEQNARKSKQPKKPLLKAAPRGESFFHEKEHLLSYSLPLVPLRSAADDDEYEEEEDGYN